MSDSPTKSARGVRRDLPAEFYCILAADGRIVGLGGLRVPYWANGHRDAIKVEVRFVKVLP